MSGEGGAKMSGEGGAKMSGAKPGRPLAGVRVVDLTRVFSGPFTTQILGDLGADVVKVERIEGGDECRAYGVLEESETVGPPFLAMNRNKRSVAMDVRTPGGREVIERLIEGADVLIDNFRPGVMKRLGLDYERVRHLNPRIVSCSISGFGGEGSLRLRAANDLSIQAFTGLVEMTGEPGGGPVRTPAPIGDLIAGLYAAIGISAALRERERTGEGQLVETSMFESLLSILGYFFVDYWTRGRVQPKMGTANSLGMPNQAFPTRDGWVCITAANERAFERCCAVLEIPEVAEDERFSTLRRRYAHREELTRELSAATQKLTSEDLLARLDEGGVSCAPVRGLAEVATDRLLEELGAVTSMEVPGIGEVKSFLTPLHMSAGVQSVRYPPPSLGEHTEEILAELGYDAAAIERLRSEGVLACASPAARG